MSDDYEVGAKLRDEVDRLYSEIGRLRAALKAARPYVEHCALGSEFAIGLLRKIDALAK